LPPIARGIRDLSPRTRETAQPEDPSHKTLEISARGSDAARTPQLAEKIFSLYTEGFPAKT